MFCAYSKDRKRHQKRKGKKVLYIEDEVKERIAYTREGRAISIYLVRDKKHNMPVGLVRAVHRENAIIAELVALPSKKLLSIAKATGNEKDNFETAVGALKHRDIYFTFNQYSVPEVSSGYELIHCL